MFAANVPQRAAARRFFFATSITPAQQAAWSRTLRGLVICSSAIIAACASTAEKPKAEPAPVIQSLEGWMQQAEAATKAGQRDQARAAYRSAASNYPTAKQPWQKLAEDYFNAADYGNAVLAGQEALQRDPQDSLTHSILAVSGLRITAGSLKALRKDAAYPVGSRDEAIAVTRSLRETLGESTLINASNNTASSSEPAAKAAPRRPAPKPAAAPAPSTSPAATAAAASPAPKPAPAAPVAKAPAAPATNPLDKLR